MTKNLIVFTVFLNKQYFKLFNNALKGIIKTTPLTDIDILLITHPNFEEDARLIISNYDSLPIQLMFLDLNTLMDAGRARLHLFNYTNIDNYHKILYLDCDTLINKDLNTLFNIDISDNIIYAAEDGLLDTIKYGNDIFDIEYKNSTLTGFSTSIMLFTNSPKIKNIFEITQLHIYFNTYIGRLSSSQNLEQPFLVYQAINKKCYNNTLITPYICNNPTRTDISNNTASIYHFSGSPGFFPFKLIKITEFYNSKLDGKSINLPK